MHRPIPLLVLILALLVPGARAAWAAGKPEKAEKPAKTAKAAGRKEAKRAQPAAPARSVGHPNEGRLEGGIRLDTARKEIRVVPTYAREDLRWGTPELVRAIERAARLVAKRYPGSVLDVGDLSRKGGGEVSGHRSHESGRDADIGLYAVDAKGQQVHARSFIRFGADLRSTNVPGARFDAGRTWLLVQHLLTDPKARVSHLFIAEPLRQALIAEAKRRGVSRALLTRAQLAMMQPTGAEPHDDHLHVRISCPRAEGGQCAELAKEAPKGRKRAKAVAARTGGKAGKGKGAKDGKAAKASRPEAQAGKAKPARRAARERRAEEREAEAPAASRPIGQVPMMLDAIDMAILQPLGLKAAPAAADADEAEADGAEARDAIDESGAPKITD